MKLIITGFIIFGLNFQVQAVSYPFLQEGSDFNLNQFLNMDVSSTFREKNDINQDFLNKFKSKKYNLALEIFLTNNLKTQVVNSETGQAIYSFLVFQNGFPVTGIHELFKIKNPKKIHPALRKLWKVDVSSSHKIWNYVYLPWNSDWTQFFDENIAIKVGSRMNFHSDYNNKMVKYFLNLPTKRNESKALLEWKFALNLISQKKMKLGTDVLSWLLDNPVGQINQSLVNLTIARLLSDVGADKSSILYYKKVNPKSIYWMFSREEMTWVFYRNGQYQEAATNSMASLGGMDHRSFLTPEMILIHSLAQIQTCSYKELHDTLKWSVPNLKIRKQNLLNARKNKKFEDIERVLAKMETKEMRSSLNLNQGATLPSYVILDRILKENIRLKKFMENYDMSMEVSDKSLIKIKSQRDQIFKDILKKVENRISNHIQRDIVSIEETLKTLKLIEVEVLYRIYGFYQFIGTDKIVSYTEDPNQIWFPVQDRERWSDEANAYQVRQDTNFCPGGSYVL